MTEKLITILNVDDNETNRYIVSRILSRNGYRVLEAATGTAGLELAIAEKPDLVILDVRLPDINGFEVCRQLRANPSTSFIPVLHLSATFVASRDKAEELDSGADAYLAQPVEEIELVATIRSLLRMRRAEETALTLAEEWQITFNAMNDGVCLLDNAGKVLRCNNALAKILAQSSGEILGSLYQDLLPMLNGSSDNPFLRVQRTGQREQREIQIGTGWYTAAIDPMLNPAQGFTGAVLTLTDITDRKQAEAALQQSQSRFSRLVESNIIGIISADTEQIIDANDAFLQMVGYSREDLVAGKIRWQEMTPPEYLHLDRQGLEELMRTGICAPFEKEYFRKDGSRIPILIGAVVVDQAPSLWVCFIIDLTERKQIEAERDRLLQQEKAARAEAEQANRVKDEFLAVLSHELRSPLNPILGWAKLLQTRKLDADKTAHALATIERNAQIQTQLIEDLLDVSRILRGKISLAEQSVNLIDTIRAALETVQLAAEAKSINITFEIANSPPPQFPVLGDPARLQQIVWNLLSNAVKFTPQGGFVQVKLEKVEEKVEGRGQRVEGGGDGETGRRGDISQSSVLSSQSLSPITPPPSPTIQHAQITVTDTGRGISPDFLPHVFEYFRQADSTTTRTFGGLGLGLAIVRYLVELHGGTVFASSPGEDQGATFTVTLPLLMVQAKAGVAVRSAQPAQDLQGVRVLVVDDDPSSREFIVFLLQSHHASVTAVTSGSEALSLFLQIQPDLLLSDIGMPEMDGYMLIKQIRSLPADSGGQIPAIALTAYAGEVDCRQAIAAGFQKHITKPVDPEQLIESICALVGVRN